MRKLTCLPEIEVIGSNLLSITDNLKKDEIKPFLGKHGFSDVQVDQWYPAINWMNLMNDLAEHTNFRENLVAIGMKLAEKVVLPPEMANATLPDILNSWDNIYHHQHRGGEIGHHLVQKVSDTEYRCVFTDIYPDDFKFGLAHGFARRFLPKGTFARITYEDNDNRMDKGGASKTVMSIKWG